MLFIVVAAGLLIPASNIVPPVFADKNPRQSEQSGDAYKFSKYTCQELFKWSHVLACVQIPQVEIHSASFDLRT